MNPAAPTQPDGIVLIDKPGGITSHDVVSILRRRLGTRKVGHAGTLDPMATGLLVVGVGRATRLLRYLSGMDKTYEGTGLLGVTTDTLDADGQVLVTMDPSALTEDAVRAGAPKLTGTIEQIPPSYSAIKVDGEALYKSARRGEAKQAPPRTVTIDAFAVVPRLPSFDFTVSCSSGTYVRTLVGDLGEALGCGAHLTALRRTRVGPFDLSDAVEPDAVSECLPLERAVAHLPRVNVSEEEAIAAGHGRVLGPAGLVGPYGVYGPDGKLVGMFEDDGAQRSRR